MCKSFSINKAATGIKEEEEITYKITTNVYSYDHVESLFRESQEEIYAKIADLEATVDRLNNRIDNIIGY